MLPLSLQSPSEVARTLAERVKALRLDHGWTQEEVAQRAGLALATYRQFERTGQISLERLLKLAVVLNASEGFDQLFVRPPARSLAELEKLAERQTRKRGRRRDAEAGSRRSAEGAKGGAMNRDRHRWSEGDDMVAFYLQRHGCARLPYTIAEIARRLGMSQDSLKMRGRNFDALTHGSALGNVAKQSRQVYEAHRERDEPELRALALSYIDTKA